METIRRVKVRLVTGSRCHTDFQGRSELVRTVLSAAPDVFNHNIETVRGLGAIRPQADYDRPSNVFALRPNGGRPSRSSPADARPGRNGQRSSWRRATSRRRLPP